MDAQTKMEHATKNVLMALLSFRMLEDQVPSSIRTKNLLPGTRTHVDRCAEYLTAYLTELENTRA